MAASGDNISVLHFRIKSSSSFSREKIPVESKTHFCGEAVKV